MSSFRPTEPVKSAAANDPWQQIKPLLRLMAILALGYVLLLGYLHYQGDPDIRRIFGNSQGLSALNHAERIDVYRVEAPANRNTPGNALEDFPIIRGPVVISQADADLLLATLQNQKSYLWEVRKACIFSPGVRFDFIRGRDQLSVLLCFECDTLVNYLNGKMVGGGNTDNARPALVRIARSLFPDDPKIRSLAEKR